MSCILIEPSTKSYHPFLLFFLAVKKKVKDISSTYILYSLFQKTFLVNIFPQTEQVCLNFPDVATLHVS